ncbi:membrane protein [Fathead minnow nidovirus]|uniref:Membrane protein n=1 Tax=Fathead minnow nidovirus TaxID=889873 RepID=I6LMN2_9NIDO|nr:membrane protein [Fathead minnow nidovirus]ADN95980.1 membrane protein [Fathead minnow nidovirus]
MSSANQTILDGLFHFSDIGFSHGNTSIFTALLTFNLLWASIFLMGFHILLATLMYYLPILTRVPLVQTVNNLAWFTACLLVTLVIYVAADSLIVKIFGAVFILLLLISAVLCVASVAQICMSFYYHKDMLLATKGTHVLSINQTYYPLTHAPPAIIINTHNGVSYFQGHNLGAVAADSMSVVLFSGKYRQEFVVNRNCPKKLSVLVNEVPHNFTLYHPEAKPTNV